MRSSQFYGNKNNTCFFLSNFYCSLREEKEPSGRPGSFQKESFFIYTFQDRDNELSFHHLWFVFQFERR